MALKVILVQTFGAGQLLVVYKSTVRCRDDCRGSSVLATIAAVTVY